LRYGAGGFGIILADLVYDGFELVCGFGRPAYPRHE
jgi:hypothetical protein